MSKCIKCGKELTSGEIPEFNDGMYDKCYKDYQCKQYPFKKGIYDMQDEIKQLKQQLAEKDKEIERLKEITIFKDSRNMTTKINGVDFSDEQIIILQNLDVLKKYDQTQLAIQELEKVKFNLKDKISMMKNEEHSYLQKVVIWYDICDQINNQIKELKGGENDNR